MTALAELLGLIHLCKHRGDRSYDEQDASHLRHPNGSLIASYDRTFLAAATREVIDLNVSAGRVVPPREGAAA